MKISFRCQRWVLISIVGLWLVVVVRISINLPPAKKDIRLTYHRSRTAEDSSMRQSRNSEKDIRRINGETLDPSGFLKENTKFSIRTERSFNDYNVDQAIHKRDGILSKNTGFFVGKTNDDHSKIRNGRIFKETYTDDEIVENIRLQKARDSPHKRPDLLLPTPIIVMGFPKAGTSSIFSFFQKQGLRSQHWYCCEEQTSPKTGGPTLMADCLLHNLKKITNKNSNAIGPIPNMFHGCGRFDVYSEINGPRHMQPHPTKPEKIGYLEDDGSIDYDGPGQRIFFPQHFRIQEIHDSFPNSTWILNWRDFDSWIESVLKWGMDDHLHNQFLNEYYMHNSSFLGNYNIADNRKRENNMPKFLKGNVQNHTVVKELMMQIYLEHFERVRKFVQLNPSHALVEVNITHENASEVLASAFGLNPDAWKNVNKNKGQKFPLVGKRLFLVDAFGVGRTSGWWMMFLISLVYLGWTLGVKVRSMNSDYLS